ncbi:hypothetical protein WAB17_05140 [Parerythrobacter aurantius]|uniref:hypothetical protein n=1 Tax=Parerythrobacter aurantius TaxID=3127706 RepID=UPI00324500BD
MAIKTLRASTKRRKSVRITPEQRAAAGEGRISKHWRTYFLQELAATSNVTRSAESAGVSPSRAYKARREHGDFAAAWRAALAEGYEHLEMEVLAYLRGTLTDRKLDVANALRLLTAHRKTVAETRALAEDEDEEAVLESLDAFIEDMRQRRLANEALLAETAEAIDRS